MYVKYYECIDKSSHAKKKTVLSGDFFQTLFPRSLFYNVYIFLQLVGIVCQTYFCQRHQYQL